MILVFSNNNNNVGNLLLFGLKRRGVSAILNIGI